MAVINKKSKSNNNHNNHNNKKCCNTKNVSIRLVFILLISILLFCISFLLYQMDSRFRIVRNKHSGGTTTTTTTSTNKSSELKQLLLLRQKRQKQHQQQHQQEQEKEGVNEQKEEVIDDGDDDGENESNYQKKNELENNQEEDEEEEEIITGDMQQQQQEEDEEEEEDDSKNNKNNNGRRYYSIELGNLILDENDTNSHTNTIGTIIIETRPDWAPIGVEHFHTLMQDEFYIDCRFFRVVTNFMVQFGIHGNPKIQKQYKETILQDDRMGIQSNSRGTISFATSGPNTRTTQLFINTRVAGNSYLDQQGFTPIAHVISGMEYVDRIYSDANELPNQGKIQSKGNEYLNKEFPQLSYIKNILPVQQKQIQDILQKIE